MAYYAVEGRIGERRSEDMIDMTNFKKSVKWYDENLATLLPCVRGRRLDELGWRGAARDAARARRLRY